MGLKGVKSRDIIDFIDGYKGDGYAKSTEEELSNILYCVYICIDIAS